MTVRSLIRMILGMNLKGECEMTTNYKASFYTARRPSLKEIGAKVLESWDEWEEVLAEHDELGIDQPARDPRYVKAAQELDYWAEQLQAEPTHNVEDRQEVVAQFQALPDEEQEERIEQLPPDVT